MILAVRLHPSGVASWVGVASRATLPGVTGRLRRILRLFLLGRDPWRCYTPDAETIAELVRMFPKATVRRILAAGPPRASKG